MRFMLCASSADHGKQSVLSFLYLNETYCSAVLRNATGSSQISFII